MIRCSTDKELEKDYLDDACDSDVEASDTELENLREEEDMETAVAEGLSGEEIEDEEEEEQSEESLPDEEPEMESEQEEPEQVKIRISFKYSDAL